MIMSTTKGQTMEIDFDQMTLDELEAYAEYLAEENQERS